MLYETGRFVVTCLALPDHEGLAPRAGVHVGQLARLQQTKSQSKVEDFECKSDSFRRPILISWSPLNVKPYAAPASDACRGSELRRAEGC